jgi:hypothetical protein
MRKIMKFKYSFIGDEMPDISPASLHIPDWYKNTKKINNNNITHNPDNSAIKNFKNCAPFLDSLTTGYSLDLWCDVSCKIENGIPVFRWQGGPSPISERDSFHNPMPVPSGHYEGHYVWFLPLILSLPKGYSAMFTHPLNRFDLPFTTLAGIVDADKKFTMRDGNIPFFIKKDFEGVIEAGTPIAQIIPFKRDSWKANRDDSLVELANKQRHVQSRKYFNFYQENMWTKKDFK